MLALVSFGVSKEGHSPSKRRSTPIPASVRKRKSTAAETGQTDEKEDSTKRSKASSESQNRAATEEESAKLKASLTGSKQLTADLKADAKGNAGQQLRLADLQRKRPHHLHTARL